MTTELTTAEQSSLIGERFRVQALFSSFVVTASGLFAAVLFVTALLITFPMMIAASATLQQKKGVRRGWQELEPVEA